MTSNNNGVYSSDVGLLQVDHDMNDLRFDLHLVGFLEVSQNFPVLPPFLCMV